MTAHTWTTTTPGYTKLRIDGRVRGYVEHATRLAFWNFLGRTGRGRSFSAIAPRGTYATAQEAMDALRVYVDAKDAVCDGGPGASRASTPVAPRRGACPPSRPPEPKSANRTHEGEHHGQPRRTPGPRRRPFRRLRRP